MAQYDADQKAGAAAVPDDAKPSKQDSERSELGNYGNLLMVTMLNPRTLVQKLGDWGRKFFVEDINLIEARVKDYEKVATLMMEKAYTFTAKERRALDEEIETKSGIRTTRMQNLGRLLHWGTDTGRQRVMQDLQVRIKDMKLPDPELKLPADVSAVDREKLVNAARMQRDADKAASFMKEAFKGLTEKEINLINTIWATNEQIYVWDEASALLAGVRLPKKLAHRSFEVTTDSGKIVRLMGGYSTATYDGITRQIDLMKSEGVQEATVNLGFTFERVSTVTGKRLDLTLEAQHREQMSRIRTAAFLPYAKRFNRIMAPNGDFVRKAQEKMGADWVRDVTNHVTFVYNGYERKGIDPVLGYVHRAQTFAVFGLNMLTAARQTLGLIVSAAHKNVGVKASIGSSVDFMMHPSTFARRVYDKSLILSQRLEGVDVDTAAPEKRLGNDRLFRKYERLATWPMRMVQAGVDVITWDAAHKQEYASQIDKGATPEAAAYAARRAADRAVIETQGSGMRSEAARINQTQVGVCVTFAGKWMLNNTNWLMRLYQGGDKAQFVKAVLASVVLSSVAMAASGALLQPEQDDEEQRDLQDYAWKAGIDMVAQPHWMGRFIADFSYALITDAPATGRAQGGIISTGAMIGQGFDQLRRGIQSDDWAKTIGGAVKAGAILPGVPSVQINRSVNAVNDDWESGWEFFLAAMFGRDRVAMVK
jgi:hypothetical protein